MLHCEKILLVRQIREADAYTIEKGGISSIDLMERAAAACVEWIGAHIGFGKRFAIMCGTGNNGGDGLAIARLLSEIPETKAIEVFILRHSERCSADFSENYRRLKNCSRVSIRELLPGEIFHLEHAADCLIDAIIGSGLSAPVKGWLQEIILSINTLSLPVVSVDIPSGLFSDTLPSPETVAVKAEHVLSFQFPKLAFMFPETGEFMEQFHVLPIGLDRRYIEQAAVACYYVTQDCVTAVLKKRKKFAHKGNFGHALVMAGSYGKIGAAVLAAKACLRAGSGLLTVHLPSGGVEILQAAFPEAMVSVDENKTIITTLPALLPCFNAIGIGPGIGKETLTQHCLYQLLLQAKVPLVLDADALNILSNNKNWLEIIPENTVLTPHVKEFERLTGTCFTNSLERLEAAKDFAVQHGVVLVLKGAHTAICSPAGDVYFNSSGNPGMATAGSGDVLTGIITSFLAQGYAPLDAAVLGVFIHGCAGDKAAVFNGRSALIASDIVDGLKGLY